MSEIDIQENIILRKWRDLIFWQSLFYSYNTLPSEKDRISQADNPELKLLSNTGLLYKGSIAQLKNATAELKECADAVEHCEIRLCDVSVPSASDYDLTSEPRYQPFDIPGGKTTYYRERMIYA